MMAKLSKVSAMLSDFLLSVNRFFINKLPCYKVNDLSKFSCFCYTFAILCIAIAIISDCLYLLICLYISKLSLYIFNDSTKLFCL